MIFLQRYISNINLLDNRFTGVLNFLLNTENIDFCVRMHKCCSGRSSYDYAMIITQCKR